MPISLMYHDIVSAGRESGFPGHGAERYKVPREEFLAHLGAISEAVGAVEFPLVTDSRGSGALQRFLTFDDGGVSAYTDVADLLEARGWRGHFFVTTDRIGKQGFLNHGQIRELHSRGHLIGSHSCTHPARISACGSEQLRHEWSRSTEVLSEIIGEPVVAASVPGGFLSRRVARAAAGAGVKHLFTSEPVTRVTVRDGCQLLGRYAIFRDTTPSTVASLVRGKRASRSKQLVFWNLKKVAKGVAGHWYALAREHALRRLAASEPQQTSDVVPVKLSGGSSLGTRP